MRSSRRKRSSPVNDALDCQQLEDATTEERDELYRNGSDIVGRWLSARSDKIYARDAARDVDVIPIGFNLDFVKLATFGIGDRKHPVMESTLDCKQVLPVRRVCWYD
jgi:hypothetical protein